MRSRLLLFRNYLPLLESKWAVTDAATSTTGTNTMLQGLVKAHRGPDTKEGWAEGGWSER